MTRNILIVGANSAIATACARIWAAEKASFFLVGRDREKLQQLGNDLMVRGAGAVQLYAFDMKQLVELNTLTQDCFATLPKVDVALIAHGTLPNQHECEADLGTALEAFSVNGLSTISLLTLLANRMEKQGSGTIAVISSVAGDRGRPSNYLYGSAKAAVTTFCEGLRGRLFKAGVHVLTIKPGFVDTPMTQGLKLPKLLLATPEKVAKDITHAVDRKTNTLYTPWFWMFIMLIIRSIPSFIFKKLPL